MPKTKSSKKKHEDTLWNAVNEDREVEIRQFIQSGIDVNAPLPATGKTPSTGETLLHFAAMWGKKKAALALIEMGANVNVTTTNYSLPFFMARGTPLHLAAGTKIDKNEEMVELLIKAKAEVDCYDENGDTPLHNAVHANYADSHVKTVVTLLAHKADPTLKDKHDMTPAELAYSDGEEALGDFLIKAEQEKMLEKSKGRLGTAEIKASARTTSTSSSVTLISTANHPNAFMPAPSSSALISAQTTTPVKLDGDVEEKAESTVMTQSSWWTTLKMKHNRKHGAKNSDQKRKIKSEIINQIIPQLVFDAGAIESAGLTFQKALEILTIYEAELSPTQQTTPTFLTLQTELEKKAAVVVVLQETMLPAGSRIPPGTVAATAAGISSICAKVAATNTSTHNATVVTKTTTF